MASYSNPLTISLNLIQQSEFSENSLGEKRHKNGRGVRQTHQIVYIWEQLGHFQAIIRPRCPSVIKTSSIVKILASLAHSYLMEITFLVAQTNNVRL